MTGNKLATSYFDPMKEQAIRGRFTDRHIQAWRPDEKCAASLLCPAFPHEQKTADMEETTSQPQASIVFLGAASPLSGVASPFGNIVTGIDVQPRRRRPISGSHGSKSEQVVLVSGRYRYRRGSRPARQSLSCCINWGNIGNLGGGIIESFQDNHRTPWT